MSAGAGHAGLIAPFCSDVQCVAASDRRISDKTQKSFIACRRLLLAIMPAMQQIEIFRTGRHTDIHGVAREFTAADLDGIAASYDAAKHEAPLVVGHPRTDHPAWGWVKSLKRVGDRLIAIPDQVQAAFSEAVQSGAYKKISAALYSPADTHNPTPGRWHLRHVGFLGAQPPAIKGLAGVAFGEGDTLDNAVVIEFAEDDTPSDTRQISPLSPSPEQTVTPDEAAALKKQNEVLQQQLDAANQREAAAAQAARTAEHVAFAEGLIAQAKVPEADKARIVALADAIHPAGEQPVMFGEGEHATTLYEQFTQFLGGLAPKVAFGEQATRPRAAGASTDQAVEYAEGADPERVELDKKIRAYMAEHNVDYRKAFAAVAK